MSELPDIVDQYLDMMRLAPERLVYVLVDLQGNVTRWGGDQELLRGRRILVGEPATDQFAGLTGIVPVGPSSVVISNFEIEPGVVVHLHAIPSPVGMRISWSSRSASRTWGVFRTICWSSPMSLRCSSMDCMEKDTRSMNSTCANSG